MMSQRVQTEISKMQEKDKRPNPQLRRERELKGWSQRTLAERLGTTEQVVNRWESGLHKPNRHFQTQLCQLFGKPADELGFMGEPQTMREEEARTDIVRESIPEQSSPSSLDETQEIPLSLPRFTPWNGSTSINELEGIGLDKVRRLMLQGALGLAMSKVFPGQMPLIDAQPTVVSAINEELIRKYDATITSCWQLYYSGGAFLVEQFLPTFLSQLVPLTQQPFKYQKALATITSRTYQLTWLLNLQHQDFGQALSSIKQSFIYAELARDSNLLLASLVREAHTFFHLNNPAQQLFLHEKAMQYVGNVSPLLQSYLYLVLAESHAPLQHEKDADYFLGLARDTFPEKPEQDPNYSYVSIDHFWFANHEVIADLHLHRPKDAWNILTQLDKFASIVPRHVELMNRQLMTLYALGDLEAVYSHFQLAVQAARQSGSSLRYHEVCTMYVNMVSRWPHESRVRKLEELLRQ